MLEAKYQEGLIDRLKIRFPGIRVEINQTRRPGYKQGWPDLTLYFGPYWALLEVKASSTSKKQPNQDHYIELHSKETFCSFIYPENEEEVLDALQLAFSSGELARNPQS